MASVGGWCEMMDRFLEELNTTLPHEKGIKAYKTKFDLIRKTNPRKAVETYMSILSPHSQKLMAKDESMIIGNNAEDLKELFEDLHVADNWTNGNLTNGSKDAIWQYLQTLFLLGNTILMLPGDTLSMIEDVAQKCVKQMENGEGQLDQQALMQGVGSLFANLENLTKKN